MIVHQYMPLHFIASCHDVKHLELMNVMNDFYLFIIKMIAIEIAMQFFYFTHIGKQCSNLAIFNKISQCFSDFLFKKRCAQ